MKVTTTSGFKLEVNENIKNDWRLAVAIADTESSDESKRLSGAVNLVRLLFGNSEDRLYEHVKSYSKGIVDATAVVKEATDVITALGSKNSGSSQV